MSLTYAAQEQPVSIKKSSTIVAVALLHVGFLYAFTHGMSVVSLIKPDTPMTYVDVPDEPEPKPEPVLIKPDLPPMPQQSFTTAMPDVPMVSEPVVEEIYIPVPMAPPPVGGTTEVRSTEPVLVRSIAIAHRVEPRYPAASRRAGESGTVLLNVVVGPDGVPTEVRIERSSGYAALDDSAQSAVRQWRFKVSGDGSYSRVRLPIAFRLESA